MLNKIKQIIKELKCKHNYEMIEGTCHMINCGQQIWPDIFAKKVNK